MRSVAAVLALVALGAFGFDAETYRAKMARFEADAEKMKKAYDECVAALAERMPAEDVSVPVEYHPDGSVKVNVTARKAQLFLDSDYVWGEGVTIVERAPDGKVVASVTANNCVIDRARKCGYVKGYAKAVYGETVIEGEGIYFSFKEEFIKILSKSKITSSDLKMEGIKL